MAIDFAKILGLGRGPLDGVIQATLSGVDSGFASAERDKQLDFQKQQFQAQQKEKEEKKSRILAGREEISALFQNPKAGLSDVVSFIGKYPELSNAAKDMFSIVNKGKEKAATKRSLRILSHLKSGNQEAAEDELERFAVLSEESGDELAASDARLSIMNLRHNPEAFEKDALLTLGSVLGADELIDKVSRINKAQADAVVNDPEVLKRAQDAKLRQSESGATTAEVEAKFAEAQQRMSLASKRAQIARFRASVGKQTQAKVQRTIPYRNGTVQLVMNDGNVIVKTADGQIQSGQSAISAINKGIASGVDEQVSRASGRSLGKTTAGLAEKDFNRISSIENNVGNLQNAIQQIDDGATTGWFQNKFPSWKRSTIALNQIRNELTLDVLGSVTFGALSEAELEFAKQTSIPTNLQGADLRDWLQRKIDAQLKVIPYLEARASYLQDNPGNLSGWRREAKKMAKAGRQTKKNSLDARKRLNDKFGAADKLIGR